MSHAIEEDGLPEEMSQENVKGKVCVNNSVL